MIAQESGAIDPTTFPLVVKPKGAAKMLGCSLSRLYELLDAGELASFKDGGSRKIPVASVKDYVARRLAASAKAA